MNERIQEFLKEDSGLPDILKSYGTAAVVKFIAKYFPKQEQHKQVISFIRRTLLCGVVETEYDEPDWPEFSSSVFYYMLEYNNNINNANNFLSEVEEQELYGLMPPPELVLNVERKERYKNFWRCLRIGDVLVCKVENYVPPDDQFVLKVMSFAERKCRYIEDLEIIIRLRVQDIPRETKLKIGDYVQGVFYACNLGLRHCYVSLKREHLGRATSIPLGVVTEDDFPLHYKLTKERPLNEMHEYMGLSDKKYLDQLSNLTKALNLDENKFYSIDLEMENFDVPATEKISWICADYTERMASHWFHRAKLHYDEGDVDKSLEAFAMGFKYEPHNITALINRAAIYGNSHNFAKSRSDLEFCLKIDPKNTRATEYLDKICRIQFTEYEEKCNPLGVANAVCRLFFVPSNENDEELQFKLVEATLESEFADMFTAFLDEVEESDAAQDAATVEETEDEESLSSLLKKKQALESQVNNPYVAEESRPQMSDVSEDEIVVSKEERRPHKKHKKKHAFRKERRKHRKEMRRYSEYSRSPTRKKSRTPSPRHRRSPHRSRKSPSFSPARSVRSRRSRSITPRRKRYSRSPSGHRSRKSRSPSPKRRYTPSPPYHYRRSPRRRRSSSSS